MKKAQAQMSFGTFDERSAETDGPYRYLLTRGWDLFVRTTVLWIMLNPSTANALEDDPTIRRIVAFSRAWGYGRARVANLFAYRSTDSSGLARVDDPVGPMNDTSIIGAAAEADLIVCAWGEPKVGRRSATWKAFLERERDVLQMLETTARQQDLARAYSPIPSSSSAPPRRSSPRCVCLGTTADGHARHPLYVHGETKPSELPR